jgi:predicted phosphodiesterase
MKIQLLSDIHVEFWKENQVERLEALIRPADVLVAAGDINVGRTNTIKTLNILAQHYTDVLYCPGNHEYYGGLELKGFDNHNKFGRKLWGNVHMLNPGSIEIGNVQFHGATLWTDFGNDVLVEQMYNKYIQDYRRIPDGKAANIKYINKHHAGYFKMAYENRDRAKKQVFFSHFGPAYEAISERWKNVDQASSLLNKYFYNDLGSWIGSLDDAIWLFGHTHDAVDVTVGQVRCLARPVGYPGEHSQPYEPLVIEI